MLRRAAALCAVALIACGAACSDDEGSAEELCAAVRRDPATLSAFDGFDPSDASDALDRLRTARVSLGELRDAAPDEVRDDLDVEIAYIQALIDGLSSLQGTDAADAVEVVRQVTEDHPDVEDASAALVAFSAEHCA
jgi:hypothetical protein